MKQHTTLAKIVPLHCQLWSTRKSRPFYTLLRVVPQETVLWMQTNWCTATRALLADEICLFLADITLLLFISVKRQVVLTVKADLGRDPPATGHPWRPADWLRYSQPLGIPLTVHFNFTLEAQQV